MAEHYYYSIASGSSGNCGLYMADGTAILIDLGVSLRRITTALKALSLTLEDISAVVLTHEHIDHVKGLPMFLKKAKAPVFATRGTAEAFEEKNPEYADRLNIFDSGERFWVRDVDVVPFPTPHDAAESTGYIFEHGGSRFGFATDLGFVPRDAAELLRGCEMVVLESNHDPHMLQAGPYPYSLKMRANAVGAARAARVRGARCTKGAHGASGIVWGGKTMLSVRLICVGKLGEKFWADAVKEYTKRLGAYCKLEIIELPEQRLPQTPSEGEIAQALEKEAALIESKLLPGASVIAMCVEGKPMSSEQLADYFGKLTVSGTSKICVLIGGSCGLSERVKKKAALRLSMSPMTFPHHLARVMVLEQIYRALNIAAGGKYHK